MPTPMMPCDLPDEYLIEIGRIAVNWNSLENELNHTLIIVLMGGFIFDGKPIAVFAHMAFQQKLDVLNAMLRIYDVSLATSYREQVQGLLTEAQRKRNTVLHQRWLADEQSVQRFNISARGELKITLAPVQLQELKDASQSIDSACSALLRVVAFPVAERFSPQEGQ